jgi:hypothetical protein
LPDILSNSVLFLLFARQRALEHLASTCRAAGLCPDAIKVHEKILALNWGDKHGVRLS